MGMRAGKYDILRKKVDQETNAQLQGQTDAIQRRFASQGMAGSGAAIKTEQIAQQEAAKRADAAKESIGFAEMENQERLDEIEKARQFQKSEREAAQKYASEESAIARRQAMDFQRAEREAAQGFSAGQAEAERGLRKQALDLQVEQFNKSFDQSVQQFKLDSYLSYQNLVTARGGNAIVLPEELLSELGLSREFFGSLTPEQQQQADDQLMAGAQNAAKGQKKKMSDPVESFKTGVKNLGKGIGIGR